MRKSEVPLESIYTLDDGICSWTGSREEELIRMETSLEEALQYECNLISIFTRCSIRYSSLDHSLPF
jgi:hypothetical protein